MMGCPAVPTANPPLALEYFRAKPAAGARGPALHGLAAASPPGRRRRLDVDAM